MDSAVVMDERSDASRGLLSFLPIFIFCLLVLAHQGNDALTFPQFWAEDGSVFFQQQLGHSIPILFGPHAGYLHWVPRLVTWAASAAPYADQPAIMNGVAWLIAGWALAFTARRMTPYVPLWVTLAIIAFSVTRGEQNGTITNVQWFLQFALITMVFAPAARPMNRRLMFMVTLLMALSGPFSIPISGMLAAFMALAFAWPQRYRGTAHAELAAWLDRLDRPAIAALVAGALLQALTLIVAPRPTGAHGGWWSAFTALMEGVLPVHILGEFVIMPVGWLFIYTCIGVLFFTGRGVAIEAKIVIFAMAALGIGLALAGLVELPRPFDLSFGYGDRYYLLARFAFWWVLYACFASHWPDKVQAGGAVVMLVAFFGAVSPNLHQRWPMPDMGWDEKAAELKQPGHHFIPINPYPFFIQADTDTSGQPTEPKTHQ